jgi:hypothetical protein
MTGWQKFERLLAFATTVLGSLSAVGWVVSVVTGGGLPAALCIVASLVIVSFGVWWLRWRERLPWWSGLVLFLVAVYPLAAARVGLESTWSQLASWCGLASLVTAAMMAARKFDAKPVPPQ